MTEQITFIQALILGIIEGITEFLPISSTGHLLVSGQMLGAPNTDGTFEIVIQLGAIIAVILYYWKKLWAKVVELPKTKEARHFWIVLFVAFFPAAAVGLLLHDYIDALLASPRLQAYVIAITLIVGGIVLWIVDRKPAEVANPEDFDCADKPLTFREAIWVGIAQCFALIPGMSRSGATIIGGLLLGLSRARATEFSFYLSIPTLGAATIYTLIKNFHIIVKCGSVASLTVGTIVSFITSYFAISWLLRYISAHNFKGFAIYRIIAGAFIIGWAYMTMG